MQKLWLLILIATAVSQNISAAAATPAGLQSQITTVLSQLRNQQEQEPTVINSINRTIGLTYAEKMSMINAYQANISNLTSQLNSLNIQYNNLVGA
jgi:hypothetical protein